jgi:hypothetical protein
VCVCVWLGLLIIGNNFWVAYWILLKQYCGYVRFFSSVVYNKSYVFETFILQIIHTPPEGVS